jgi:hypothetical protein
MDLPVEVVRHIRGIIKKYDVPVYEAELIVSRAYGALTLADLMASYNTSKINKIPDSLLLRGSISKNKKTIQSSQEKLLEQNKAYFVSRGIDFSMFEPTMTGLNKAILDATTPVRAHFEAENFHFFTLQSQGPEHKVAKSAFFVTPVTLTKITVSLYRPLAKSGDPRMWFSSLDSFAVATEQIAIVVFNDALYLFNFSRIDLTAILESDHVGVFINAYLKSKGSIAEELLGKLKVLAQRPLPATVDADTAIGRAIERALGIEINSSKLPDYKGIEIKTGRADSMSRSNLFAQVADWSISPCSSSAAILGKYGYPRGEILKLNCTVSTKSPNSQGLQFFYDENKDQLLEKHKDGDVVAIWPGQVLRDRLLEKHAETFWISAESIFIDGVEHFQLTSVIHTKKPIQAQLMPLIESGVITMDHLIKGEILSTGKVRGAEKGPLFKLDKRNLGLLFPNPVTYAIHK